MKKLNWHKSIKTVIILGCFFFLFFPHYLYNGYNLGPFTIDINLYEKYANFLMLPISTVSIYLIYITYRSQKEELQETSKALNNQLETNKIQQFESSLFNLINLKNTSLNSITEKSIFIQNEILYGDIAVGYYLGTFIGYYKRERKKYIESSSLHKIKQVFRAYEFNNGISPKLIQHFKLLDAINISFENNGINTLNHYNNILNSILMKNESIFYFYYVLGSHEYKDAVSIIDKFMLTSNFLKTDLIDENLYDYDKLNS